MTNAYTSSPPYPYLRMEGVYICADSRPFMAETKRVALAISTDSNQPTGAVIGKDGKIIGSSA